MFRLPSTIPLSLWYKGLNYTIHKYMFRLPSSVPSSRWHKGLNCRVQGSKLAQVTCFPFFFLYCTINIPSHLFTLHTSAQYKNVYTWEWVSTQITTIYFEISQNTNLTLMYISTVHFPSSIHGIFFVSSRCWRMQGRRSSSLSSPFSAVLSIRILCFKPLFV